MEPAYSSSSSASSATAAYLSQTKQLPHLHSVRRPSSKPWRKPAVAPLPSNPPRVYKVDPINFRDLVQRLTSAPEFLAAPTPPQIDIHVSSVPNYAPAPKISSAFSATYKDLSDTLKPITTPNREKAHDSTVDSSYLALSLQSPSSHHWFSYPLPSPGTLSSLEQRTVL